MIGQKTRLCAHGVTLLWDNINTIKNSEKIFFQANKLI
jgi:hypothetical protein